MRLKFPGTGGYHPNERRHTACLLLPDIGIALDAGTGFFRVQHELKTRHVDVFLSHAHLDHVCGLTFFLVPVLKGDVDQVRIHGTADALAAVRRHVFAQEIFPVDPPFQWCDLQIDKTVPVADGGTLSWIPLEHPGGSAGFRLDWPDRSVAYITDTTAPGSYESFIHGVDVLIHECYFPDEMTEWAERTGHSSSTAVAHAARRAKVGRLYVVHTDPQRPEDDPVGLDGIRDVFPNTELAEDLQEIEF